jgi:hypothetical protein
MIKRILLASRPVTLLFVFAVLLPGTPPVATAAESVRDVSQNLTSPPSREEQSMFVLRLQIARKDLETFTLFAENFRKNGDQKSLDQLQRPVDDFLRMHLNNLLLMGVEQGTLETARLAAEIMLARTMLFLSLGQKQMARDSIAEIKNRFGAYQKISVEVGGRRSTLDEMIRQLDGEVAENPVK